jgi:hypothetical protein
VLFVALLIDHYLPIGVPAAAHSGINFEVVNGIPGNPA